MTKKIYLQLFLVFMLLAIALFLFNKYFKKGNLKSELNTNIEQSVVTGESLIEDLKYLSTDKEGNEYKIEEYQHQPGCLKSISQTMINKST